MKPDISVDVGTTHLYAPGTHADRHDAHSCAQPFIHPNTHILRSILHTPFHALRQPLLVHQNPCTIHCTHSPQDAAWNHSCPHPFLTPHPPLASRTTPTPLSHYAHSPLALRPLPSRTTPTHLSRDRDFDLDLDRLRERSLDISLGAPTSSTAACISRGDVACKHTYIHTYIHT